MKKYCPTYYQSVMAKQLCPKHCAHARAPHRDRSKGIRASTRQGGAAERRPSAPVCKARPRANRGHSETLPPHAMPAECGHAGGAAGINSDKRADSQYPRRKGRSRACLSSSSAEHCPAAARYSESGLPSAATDVVSRLRRACLRMKLTILAALVHALEDLEVLTPKLAAPLPHLPVRRGARLTRYTRPEETHEHDHS
jgi:hypothetical protein